MFDVCYCILVPILYFMNMASDPKQNRFSAQHAETVHLRVEKSLSGQQHRSSILAGTLH